MSALQVAVKRILISCHDSTILGVDAELPTTCMLTKPGRFGLRNAIAMLLTQQIGFGLETHLCDRY